jgi:hypothetical protein
MCETFESSGRVRNLDVLSHEAVRADVAKAPQYETEPSIEQRIVAGI